MQEIINEEYLKKISYSPVSSIKRDTSVILVIPPSPQIPTPGREFLLKTPIEGVSYVATTLRNAGYEVKIIDYRLNPQISLEKIISSNKRSVIAIASFVDSFCFLEDFIKKIKEIDRKIPVILGGPFVSSAPKVLMENLKADFAVLGEAELTILELMDILDRNRYEFIPNIKGIVYKNNGKIVFNSRRENIMNLDNLPLLDFSLWIEDKDNIRFEKLGFSSTRGCLSRCSFCFKTIPFQRMMSAKKFTDEVNHYVERYGLKFAFINDLNFITLRKRTIDLCKGLKKTGIRWSCSTRVDNIDEELLKIMKDSGCEEIWYGFESVDQKVLDMNFKGITTEQIYQAVELTAKAGIKVMGNFIIGLLGETEESLEKMVHFIEEKEEVIPCSIKYLAPFPGTYIYHYALKKGLIKDQIEYFRMLSRRKVNYLQDEIINCTELPEQKLRYAFKRIRDISYKRYGPLDW